jgi:sulfonate dioxygenase
MSAVETVTEASQTPSTLNLRGVNKEQEAEPYPYAHLLPHFSPEKYPPLTPFKHEDPGFRALQHADPRTFLKNATSVVELTPNLGTEVHGINLTTLDSDGRDQLALEVGSISVL